MGESLLKKAMCLFLFVAVCLSFGQTREEEDVVFAAGVFNLKVRLLMEGDLTDRSVDFPKTELGDLMKGIYQSTRRGMVRDVFLDRRIEETHLYDVVDGEWFHSPKASLRELAKVSALYASAKKARNQDMQEIIALLAPKQGESPSIRDFKAGARNGMSQSLKQIGDKDAYTLSLIYLARWEDAFHFLDQNQAGAMTYRSLVVFADEKTQAAWTQKMNAIDQAAVALGSYSNLQNKRIKEFKAGPKGGAGSVAG